MINTLIITLHIAVALALIVIVLFQQGKGASMGSAFGGSSQTLFGSRGAASPMAKVTTVAAVIFMLTSITLSIMSKSSTDESVIPAIDGPAQLPVSLPEKDTSEAKGPSAPAEPVEQDRPESAPSSPIGPVETSPPGEGSPR